MARQLILTTLILIITFEYGRGEELWCYNCNTDLRFDHTTECNDPYVPTPYFDLVPCPQNNSHHCLKSVITYRDVLVTVRGCVTSREIDGYCRHEKYFPKSSITCSFCKDYACNGQTSIRSFVLQYLGFFPLYIYILINCS